MRVTIAICTWNRADLLRETLERLTEISVPTSIDHEIVVVNNNCTDHTDAVIETYRSRLPMRRVFERQPGASLARNAALEAATSADYLVYFDDDVLVDRSWFVEFEAAVNPYPNAAAFGGLIDPWFPTEPDPDLTTVFPLLKSGFCAQDFGQTPRPLVDGEYLWTANLAFRTAALKGQRFNPLVPLGEDLDFIQRLRDQGGTIMWWPSLRIQHYVIPKRMTARYLLRRTRQWGTGQAVTGRSAEPVASFLGVPRWLMRSYATAWLRYFASFVTRADVLTYKPWCANLPTMHSRRRIRVLSWRRELAHLSGMIYAYRDPAGAAAARA